MDANTASDNKKRARSSNFTVAESRLLVDEVCKRKKIIENKQTDAVTCKQKEDAWINLESAFNANSGSTFRSTKMLKIKYEGIKRSLKQKRSKEKCGLYRTGGGPPDTVTYTDYEEKLLAIISTQVDGLHTQNDCDKDLEIPVIPPPEPVECTQPIVIDAPMSTAELSEDERCNNITRATSHLEPVAYVLDIPIEIDMPNEEATPIEASASDVATNATGWQSWTPQKMKEPPHKALQQKTNRKANLEQKFSKLANSREELVKLQLANVELEKEVRQEELQLMKERRERETAKHELEMEILKLKQK